MVGVAYSFDGFELDTARCELRLAGERIRVEPRALDVLKHLIVHRDRVVSREELLDSVWGDRFVSEAALTTALRTVRVAVGDSGREQRLIRTVTRRGYRFVGAVTERATGSRPAWTPAVPLPPRLGAVPAAGFAGREKERAALGEARKVVAASGRRQVVLVSGEAGIGKTTLCSVVAAEAHRDGAVVLYGRCDEELSVPYQPWRDVLASLDRHAPEALDGREEGVATLLGHGGAGDLESDSARFALFNTVVDVLEAASPPDEALLIVLDDLHRADSQTLALLRHLIERALTVPVLLVATFRDAEVDPSHPLATLLAAVHSEPGTTRLELRGLDDEELLGLLESGSGRTLDRDGLVLRDALRAETGGNPFFVTEILRHLIDIGAIDPESEHGWAAPTDLAAHGLPVSVREVVGLRVERLGPATRRALQIASVIGRDFDLDLLAELLDEDLGQVFGRLGPAVDNTLLVDTGGRFAFTHAIVAHTLYAGLRPTDRAFVHRSVAEALERRSRHDPAGQAAQIAHHWINAIGPGAAGRAADHTLLAADHALTHLAPDEAITWYRRTLELVPPDRSTRRCEILVGLGTAQRQAGDPTYRETLLDAGRLAIDLGLDGLLVRAALANNRGEVSGFAGTDDERIEILQNAIAARPSGADGALLQAILAIEIHGRSDELAQQAVSRALTLAREADDARIMVRVVRLTESALRVPGALGRREAILSEGIAAASRTDDPLLHGVLSISHHGIATEGGDREAMNRAARIRDAFSQRSPEPYVRWSNRLTRAMHRFLDGDLAGAEAEADAGFELGVATGQPEAFLAYAAQIFEIRRAQGRLDEIAGIIEQMAAEDPTIEVVRAALAYVWSATGREAEARELAGSFDPSPGGAPQFWSTTLMLWAEVSRTLGLPAVAAQLVPLLDGWRGQVASNGATTQGAFAHGLGGALAALGRIEEASAAYDLALAVNRRLQSPLLVARTQLAHAELLAGTRGGRAV